MTRPRTITVGELRMRLLDTLEALPDNAEVFFGTGDLTLCRLVEHETVGDVQRVQVEFNEAYRLVDGAGGD